MGKTVGLFLAIMAVLSPCTASAVSDSLLERVEVKTVKLQFSCEDSACRQLFFKQFAMTPFVEQFFDLSAEGWFATRIQYEQRIMGLAAKKRYDTASLAACFTKIQVKPMDDIAQIPIAAYWSACGKERVWVILCVWEYATKVNDKYLSCGHIKGWAFSAKDQKLVCSMSCM